MPNSQNIAVVGCGYWGKNLVRNFSGLGALACLCDSDCEQADKLSTQYQVPVRKFDEVLNDPTIQGVVIATPASQHATMAEKALHAGKHVFVEKPLAFSCWSKLKKMDTDV